MTPTLVRPANIAEAPALGTIGFDAWLGSAFAVLDHGRTDRVRLRHEFESFCATKSETILVAEVQGAPVGWGAREDGDHVVSDLWVSPAAQGTGIGTALLAALEDVIRRAGHPAAELETAASNAAAIRFYERHGYGIAWRREKLSATLGYALDKVGLSKPLGEGRMQA